MREECSGFQYSRREYWYKEYKRCESSGMKVSEYCRERGISASSYWSALNRYGFSNSSRVKNDANFKEVISAVPSSEVGIEVRYKDFCISIAPESSPLVIKRLLTMLQEL